MLDRKAPDEEFSKKDLIKESESQPHVNAILFSKGTYQVEVVDGESHWIFLQISDEGEISDQFCNCNEAEKSGQCVHLEVGKKAIFAEQKLPIHTRFQTSLWNLLFERAGREIGYDPTLLEKVGEEFREKKGRFILKPKSLRAKEILLENLENRKEETEETSLKFSNLDPEELLNWKRGKPSRSLQYELSFWSDLAKWLMVLDDQGEEIRLIFKGDVNGLPNILEVNTKEIDGSFQIAENFWPEILPKIGRYKTNIPVYAFRDLSIQKILYDEKERAFIIEGRSLDPMQAKTFEYEWDNWIYRKGVGFFSKETDPLLKQKKIEGKEVLTLLEKYPKLLEDYLENVEISQKPLSAAYHLFFDREKNLHIECYIHEPGDLTRGVNTFFDPWVYLSGQGFFRVTNLLFRGGEKIIEKEVMGEFIERNRNWLNKFDGFQIHLSNLETKMTYRMEGEILKIEVDRGFTDQTTQEILDFGNWIYIKKNGFYSRGKNIHQKFLLEPIDIPKNLISTFITEHKEDLDQIQGFFYIDSSLEKSGLVISYSEEEITIEPKYQFREGVDTANLSIYGDYIYSPGKGFAEIPDTMKIPKKFAKALTIPKDHFPYFFKHELGRLKPYILHLDKCLIEPTFLKLVVRRVQKQEKGWLFTLVYQSSYGEVPLRQVYDAFHRFGSYELSDAGMLHLKDKRFKWLSKIGAEAFQGDNALYLSTLDWIRLTLFEEPKLSPTDDEKEQSAIATLMNLQELHLLELPSLKGFESKLRPYQEVGVKWLWFLYTYGLSGFLCDEMGLGKTHQAMALMAAIMEEKKRSERKKFLVVCPTSVIYHWQELLERFLKKAKVHLYHGPFRNSKQLKLKNDIVLTTYGILRSDKDLFAKMEFEVVILDEMQVAKNHKSQIHSTLKKISADMKLALTGTPVENNLWELKALFDIILPGFLPTSAEFKEEFITPIEKNRDREKEKILNKLIHPFVLRRKKQDVLSDLPEKIEEIAYVELSNEQRALYERVALQSKDLLKEQGGEFYLHVFALLNKLKQICDHPALYMKDKESYLAKESGKWEYFIELLDEARASKQKLVIFSQYLDMLDIIEMHLKHQNIQFAGIRGSTKDRKGEVKRFQEDPACEVFVASLNAAGVGIDLTAASVVIHYDRWWNPAKEDQATDRVHRIGQNRGVSVFKLVSKNTIEEHIHHMIEKKKQLIHGIVGFDSEEEIKKLDRSELLILLKKIYTDIQ